jgi:signal transduction histidine kinase
LSAGLLTVAVAGNVINAMLPSAQSVGALGLAVTALSAVLYYFAFVPPRWLRRAWQFEELSDYFAQTKLTATRKPTSREIFQQLCMSAKQTVNGLASAAIRKGEGMERWETLATTDPLIDTTALQSGHRLLQEAWQKRQSIAVYVPDLKDGDERRQMESVGARTWLLVPILASGHRWGILLLLLRDRSLFIEDDLHLLELFTQQCASVLENYRLIAETQGYSEQLEARVNERTQQLAFLANASRVLSESLDFSDILSRMAQLVVPQLADWCSVDIVDEEGVLQRLAVVHRDPNKLELAHELQEHFPPKPYSRHGAYNALQTGQAIIIPNVTPEMLMDNVNDPEMVDLLLKLGCESSIAVPLLARGRTLGTFSLIMGESGRHYGESDLALAEELGRRAALLFDNAKLFGETQEMNAELEQRVQERTAHLLAVNKELEAFSYSVSHDLRAPLRAINGFSQALLEDCGDNLDETGHEFLGRIRTESQRMGQLIDDLIGLSRLTRTEMHQAEVDLSALARDIAANLKSQAPGRDVYFMIQEDIVSYGDERLLRVVLQNLLGNAWKFTAKREHAQIEFGALFGNGEPEPAESTEFYVRDNGAGFNMAYVNKLFGAFQRLHAMTEYEGTGIGLATVQRIIHRHGGTIRAEGEVDKGATFYFTLGEKA